MRNLFDQYSQPENRLTHALMSCLAADRRLLNKFVLWSTGQDIRGRRLDVLEQSLPGEPIDLPEDEAERRGLPDGCITDRDDWALLVESKFAAGVSVDQLRRHLRTARRRGLYNSILLLISVGSPPRRLPRSVVAKTWTDVYRWLSRWPARSTWARHCIEYLEIAEARGAAEEYLQQGTLTVFSGIPFGPANPYTYVQAKRVLGLLRDELCRDRRLEKRLGANLGGAGRPAITERDETTVWDFIPLKEASGAQVFTQYPHLTFALHADYLEARVTIPNGIRSQLRTRLLGSSFETFQSLIHEVTDELRRALRHVSGAVPEVVVVQRHYQSQRSKGIIDCLLRFDPRTSLPKRSRVRGGVKSQPQWIRAVYEALASRRSNIQFQVGASFPYRDCRIVGTPKITRAIADVWLACKPVLDGASG
jgi:hypothetical protein